MSKLENHLEAFADDRISLATLSEEVSKLVSDEAVDSSNMMLLLSQAHQDGHLDGEQCHELLSVVVNADQLNVTAPIDSDDGEKTQAFRMQDAGAVTTVGVGSCIKDRFLLEKKLGEGGMGVVYQARDRIKTEAKDRNPFVAIKVLNENFKFHPESYIALQRECSKAQRLAHPNIATVYDFDRTGGMAYMTMELLRGFPLNTFIKSKIPEHGMMFDDAWPIIKGLGEALGHAHKNQLVHSDFKPANAFLCEDGQVKVIDFGIARAVRKPGETQFTHFDASTLGALTPAYASPEMLEGEDPDPRDDVFALGVVTYILLSNRHPYDRNAANVALAMKLKPKPIEALSRLQNVALERALHLEADYRTPDMETFLDELRGESELERRQALQSKLIVGMGIALAAMTGFVIYLLSR